ncbi:YopX family protein [Streptococcus anginosus]|uniref:YopX family protein n=1 Tax=Streptococcus anginosus TaxID=1328 RepID=UPI00308190E1
MIKLIPKFRAWDKTHKKLGLIDADMQDGYFQSVKILDEDEDDWQESENFILMQFTGLKDKNGTEIFEGDVVRLLDSLYTVFYDSEKGSYRLKPHDDRWVTDYMSNFSHGGNFEVVGNICEGKEYL